MAALDLLWNLIIRAFLVMILYRLLHSCIKCPKYVPIGQKSLPDMDLWPKQRVLVRINKTCMHRIKGKKYYDINLYKY